MILIAYDEKRLDVPEDIKGEKVTELAIIAHREVNHLFWCRDFDGKVKRRRGNTILVELTRSLLMERRLQGGANDDLSRRERVRVGGEGSRERDKRERERERESHTDSSLSPKDKKTRRWDVGIRVCRMGLKSNRWRFVKVWTSPHPDGPAAALLMGQENSQVHFSRNT